jgi:hypothetical protein
VGAVFNLGKTNTVDAISKLVGSMTSSLILMPSKPLEEVLSKVDVAPLCTALAMTEAALMWRPKGGVVSGTVGDL